LSDLPPPLTEGFVPEYSVSIYSKSQGLLQTLMYTTYGPSALGNALPGSPWTRSPDGRHLQSMHDGSLVCFQAGHQGLEWATEFSAPVASVFDVAVSRDADGTQPVVFPHSTLSVPGSVVGALRRLPDTAFIGRLGEETLFAMSTEHYPLVAFAPGPAELGDSGGLVGLQRLETPQSAPGVGLEGAPERLGIDAPEPSVSPPLFPPFTFSENSTPARYAYLESAVRRPSDSPWAATISVLVALVFGFLGARWVYGANWEAELDHRLRLLGRNSWLGRHSQPSASSPAPPQPPPALVETSSEDVVATSSDSGRMIETAVASPDKELPPLPLSLPPGSSSAGKPPPPAEDAAAETEGESGGDDRDGAAVNAKRKGRRRRRGRKPGQRVKAEAEAAAAAAAMGTSTTNAEDGDGKAVVQGETTEETVEDRVGALVVSNSLLGKWTDAGLARARVVGRADKLCLSGQDSGLMERSSSKALSKVGR
jgi:serine/threonine-protein kinase/endoribonuclease IRE1